MKFKLIVKLIEKILGMREHGDEPRADLYLPDFLLAFGIVLMLFAVGLAVAGFIMLNIWLFVVGAVALVLGASAVLCWRNQTIRVLSDEQFEYITFLGTVHVYNFSDITGLRRNNDSLTLFVGKKKVHLESMAIMSERLAKALSDALEK